MDILSNMDLLSVAIVVASTCVIGFAVFFSNPTSSTNRAFLGFALITAIWGVVNYAVYQTADAKIILWTLRFVLFFAVWQAFFLFELFYAFPEEHPSYTSLHKYLLLPLVVCTSIITLTPFTFSHIVQLSVGTISDPDRGPGLIAFGFVAVSLVATGLYFLLSKMRAIRREARGPFRLLLIGATISFCLIILFNFLVPVVLHNLSLIPLGAIFMFPLIACTGYAILHHQIFSVKVAATALLVFMVSIMSFVEIIFTKDPSMLLFRISVFVLILVAGVLLTRGVIREVQQRELIQKQEKELEVVNAQQENLLHFISHEIKGYLTKSEGGFAGIVEGDYGAISSQLKDMATAAVADVRKGVATVMQILNASNLKKGTVSYAKRPFDFKKAVLGVANDLKPVAQDKHLIIETAVADGNYMINGDEERIRADLVRNLIDNAIRYSMTGNIHMELVRTGTKMRFSVKDSGIGITTEDMQHLFTEGGRGKDSLKTNVHSTGYGLFIAKSVVEAHGGRIWAESEGKGKGSLFTVELPAV